MNKQLDILKYLAPPTIIFLGLVDLLIYYDVYGINIIDFLTISDAIVAIISEKTLFVLIIFILTIYGIDNASVTKIDLDNSDLRSDQNFRSHKNRTTIKKLFRSRQLRHFRRFRQFYHSTLIFILFLLSGGFNYIAIRLIFILGILLLFGAFHNKKLHRLRSEEFSKIRQTNIEFFELSKSTSVDDFRKAELLGKDISTRLESLQNKREKDYRNFLLISSITGFLILYSGASWMYAIQTTFKLSPTGTCLYCERNSYIESDTLIYIGKTSDYIFFYDKFRDFSYSVNLSGCELEVVQDNRFKFMR